MNHMKLFLLLLFFFNLSKSCGCTNKNGSYNSDTEEQNKIKLKEIALFSLFEQPKKIIFFRVWKSKWRMSRKHYKVECTPERRFVAITRMEREWESEKLHEKNSISE